MQLQNRSSHVIINSWMIIFLLFTGKAFAESVSFASFVNSAYQKTVVSQLFHEYEKNNPGTKVELAFFQDAEFKQKLGGWLSSPTKVYDLIAWQGGERLYRYVRQGQVAPISEFIPRDVMRDAFTQGSLGAVTYQGEMYALPMSYYQWGIFYRKSIFAKAGLTPPRNWQEFIRVCNALKQQGITPLALGNSGKWPASAWFDYLDLRINGLEFHNQLLQGQHSFLDPRVQNVFSHWKELVDNGFFIKHTPALDWYESLPFIYHSYAAMTLIGNFVTGELPATLIDDFAFMPFPRIDTKVALYEDAPLDVLIVPRNANLSSAAKKLLAFMGSNEFQSVYNQRLGMISPNKKAKVADDVFIRSGAQLLAKASGVAQFFDRDTKAAFVSPALGVFADFLESGNVERAQQQLEKLKDQYLVNAQ